MVTEAEAAEAELTGASGSGQVVDEETISKLQQAIDDLNARYGSTSDPQEAAELGEQIEQIEQYLDRARSLSGEPRPMRGSPLKRDADAVRSSIQLAIKKIKQCDKPCTVHFRQSIRTGTELSYVSSPELAWVLS